MKEEFSLLLTPPAPSPGVVQVVFPFRMSLRMTLYCSSCLHLSSAGAIDLHYHVLDLGIKARVWYMVGLGLVHGRPGRWLGLFPAELRPSPSFLFQRTGHGGSFGCFLCLRCYFPLPPQMLSSAPGTNSAKLASTTPSCWPYSHIPGQEKAEAWVLSLTWLQALTPKPGLPDFLENNGPMCPHVGVGPSHSPTTLWSEEGWFGMGWETVSVEGELPLVPHWRREEHQP